MCPEISKEELFQKAMDEMAQGRLEAAIEALNAVLQTDPQYTEALQALSMLYYQTGRHEEAIRAGRRLVQLNPEDILAHTSLSMFYVAKGMVPQAEAEANEARRLTWKQQLKNGNKG